MSTAGAGTPTESATAAVSAVVEGLVERGWAVVPDFLPPACVAALAAELDTRLARGEFREAAVGAGANRAVRRDVRSDLIHWVTGDGGEAEVAALAALESLRVELNGALQLGLHELECHYALYPPGAYYARHLDRSPAGVERVVSVVLYLNPEWGDGDGGELRLYPVDEPVDVRPEGGTLAVFLSERLEHEVLPARRPRSSLTGWFRRRTLGALW
jgi:SM-20-related protein